MNQKRPRPLPSGTQNLTLTSARRIRETKHSSRVNIISARGIRKRTASFSARNSGRKGEEGVEAAVTSRISGDRGSCEKSEKRKGFWVR
jgi:hypothetical protein